MDDNKDIVIDGENEQQEAEQEEVTQKVYTEQDIQNSFNAGVKKASSEWQRDEKYKEFLAWKKTNQSETERINELTNTNAELTNQNSALQYEIDQLNARIMVDQSDVKKEFSRFVTSEVLDSIEDMEDFGRALKEFKKNNPQYFGETVIKKIQTAPRIKRRNTSTDHE